ncbi:MAG: PQQ-like beta-propeller repeat protein, partial [Gemmataceae bacterium]|nr:PQQ-like beta-propeller repeat protein [Gemmataceae bacterium]
MNATQAIAVGGMVLLVAAGGRAQDWPQWRGPGRDNKVAGFSVPATWPKELTKQWRVKVGVGEASPVLVGDKLYIFSRQGDEETTICLDAATGKEIWKDQYAAEKVVKPASAFPGPRSTPAAGEGKVCTLGVGGVVSCLDAASGKVVWRKDTRSKPQFNTSTSPLIIDGKCVVFVDGLTAFDLKTGEVHWAWKGAAAPYGSPVLMTLDGVVTVVTPAVNTLAGVRLADGKLLWKHPIGPGGKDYQHNFSTPLVAGDTVWYSMSTKGKGGSTIALKIAKKGDDYEATELWKKPFAAAGYHTPLLRDNLIFGVSQLDRNFFCLDAKTGEPLWFDKDHQRGQCGSILDVGSVLLALTSDKELIAFPPSKTGFTELAKYKVADAETWCVPIVAGRRIYVKDKGGSLTLW